MNDTPIFVHFDRLFIRAVELGCAPEPSGVLWLCTCVGRVHAGCHYGPPLVTEAGLHLYAKKVAQ
jgi:hypothetical protein